MAWVDSATNDQRLLGMPNPVGYIWDENHPAQGPQDGTLYCTGLGKMLGSSLHSSQQGCVHRMTEQLLSCTNQATSLCLK